MSGEGLDLVFEALTARLSGAMAHLQLKIPPQWVGRFRSKFFELGCIVKEAYEEDGCLLMDIRLPLIEWARLQKREGTELEDCIVTD